MASLRSSLVIALFLTIPTITLAVSRSAQPVEGEWIVTRKDRTVPWSQISKDFGPSFQVRRTFGPGNRFALVRSTGKRVAMPVIKGVITSQPNFRYFAFDNMDPDFEKSWGLNNSGQSINSATAGYPGKDVGASKAWAVHSGNGQVVVAIIDSGIELAHEDLKNNIWVNPGEIANNGIDDDKNGYIDDVNGWNFNAGNSNPNDDNGHGTFCGGIVGAEAGNKLGTRGVNWNVKLMAVKFLDSGGGGTTEAAIDSITYAVNQGAQVINASWGGTSFDQALYDVVKWSGEQGVLFVAAAGNSGKNNDTHSSPMYPAAFLLPKMLTVAAYDNRDRLATFSNFGKNTTHLGAPGVDVYSSTLGGYKFGDGTSFAAPFVSGAAALLKSFDGTLSMAQVRDRLIATSEVISYYEKERVGSGGRVHLFNALRNIRPPRPQSPTVWQGGVTFQATAHPYANDSSISYTIEHPGATHLRVHFKGFHTEGCCDRVVLKDSQGREVATYAGELGDFWSADALGDTMIVEFTSDFSITEHGFEIDSYDVSFESNFWALLQDILGPWRSSKQSKLQAVAPYTPAFF